MEEIWKTIPETNGLYEASNLGNIRRIYSQIFNKHGNIQRYAGGYNLKPQLLRTGYYQIIISVNGKHNKKTIHRLIASTFIKEIPKGMVVNHIDGNKTNNTLNNLEIVSYSQNALHSMRVLKNNSSVPKGEKHFCSKLSENEVLDIRKKYNDGINIKCIAEVYDSVSLYAIKAICYRQNWKHI